MISRSLYLPIDAPPERIWPWMHRVTEWPRWVPTILAVEPEGDPALRVGTRYLVRQPKLDAVTYVVTQVDEGRGFTWETRAPGSRIVAEHRLTPEAEGRTGLLLRVSFHGIVGVPLGLIFSPLTRRYLGLEAEAFRSVSTAGGPADGAAVGAAR